MAYNNYSKSGAAPSAKFDDNISTNGVAFINNNTSRMLNVNYWGRNMSLEIATVPMGTPMTWEARKSASTLKQVISYHSLSDFVEICEDIIASVKSSGRFISSAIRCGSKGDCMIEISNGENINMPTGIYLVIYKGIDQSNRTNIMEFYQFDGTKVIHEYNHATGSMKEDISKIGEFKKFVKTLKSAEGAFTMAHAHTVAEVKKGDKLAAFKALAAISSSMGVDLTKDLLEKKSSGSSSYTRNQQSGGGYQRKYSGGYQKGGSGYNAPRGGYGNRQNSATFENQNNPTYQAAMAAINNDPIDLNLDMSQLQEVDLDHFPG